MSQVKIDDIGVTAANIGISTEELGSDVDAIKRKVRKLVLKAYNWVPLKGRLFDIFKIESGLFAANLVAITAEGGFTPKGEPSTESNRRAMACVFLLKQILRWQKLLPALLTEGIDYHRQVLSEGDDAEELAPKVVTYVAEKLAREMSPAVSGMSFAGVLTVLFGKYADLGTFPAHLLGSSMGVTSGRAAPERHHKKHHRKHPYKKHKKH